MSVSLRCPNCDNVIGEASHEDNYKENFYYKNENGEPICKNCGTGIVKNPEGKILIIAISLILIFIALAIFCQ